MHFCAEATPFTPTVERVGLLIDAGGQRSEETMPWRAEELAERPSAMAGRPPLALDYCCSFLVGSFARPSQAFDAMALTAWQGAQQ